MDELCRLTGVKQKLSTAYHPQTDGNTEILNQYIDQRLRPFVNHFQDNWSDLLPAMDFAQAILPHESTLHHESSSRERKPNCSLNEPLMQLNLRGRTLRRPNSIRVSKQTNTAMNQTLKLETLSTSLAKVSLLTSLVQSWITNAPAHSRSLKCVDTLTS